MNHKPKNFAVWTEIPCTDIERSMAFYSKVFDFELKLDESGPNPVVMFPTADKEGVSGHLYPGKPAREGEGATVHFAAPDTLEKTIVRVKEAGGQVLSEAISIPAGRFAYCLDPDGNSIGVFQA